MIFRKTYLKFTLRTKFFAFAFFAINIANAQVQIQSFLPTAGLVQKNQLWNLMLINSTAQQFNGRLELVLRDRQTGTELLTATTTNFSLPVGSLQVNINLLNPIQYNYTGMQPDGTINGL